MSGRLRTKGTIGPIRRGRQKAAVAGASAAALGSATGQLPSLASLPNIANNRVLGRDAGGSGAVEELSVGGGLGFSGAAQLLIVDGGIVLAKLANQASLTVLARSAGGSGPPAALTLTQLLDLIAGGAVQGDVMFRDASDWKGLAPGTAGFVLTSAGAGANPTYTDPSSLVNAVPISQLINKAWGLSDGFIARVIDPASGQTSGIGGPVGSLGGSLSQDAQSDARYALVTGSATINSFAGFGCPNASGGLLIDNLDFTIDFVMRTGATITSVRYLFGVGSFSNSAPTNADVPSALSTARWFQFRFSTNVPDPGWVGLVWDGSTTQVTGSLSSFAASTKYRLRIRKSGTSVFFSVNGGAETALTTSAGGAHVLNPFCGVYNLIASARTWSFSRYACSLGT